MTANANRRVDIYQTITDQIIAAVETGTGPVEMPWHRSGSGITQPVNVESGKPYRGINTVALGCSHHRQLQQRVLGYLSPMAGARRTGSQG